MRLSQLAKGVKFRYMGQEYVRDLTGRDGSGRMAVRNVRTGEQLTLAGNSEVELIKENPKFRVKKQKRVWPDDQIDFTPVDDLQD